MLINYLMRNSREEEDFNRIQEISCTSTTTSMASSNSTSWSRFKDPRIVRVSRASGGKDRHSKVCTVRGLRDRRVRLSVPTAIQLYDLQDRLGLNQPSKVVDWLLNVSKHEIAELPPLRFPDGFSQNLHHNPAFLEFGGSQSNKEALKISGSTENWDDSMKYSKSDVFWGKTKDVPGGKGDHRDGNWPRNQEDGQFNFENQGAFLVSAANNLLFRPNPSSLPVFLDSNTIYNNEVFRWDPSNLTLSQPSNQAREDLHDISLMPMAGSHPIRVYQSGTSSLESHFPSSNSEFDPKQLSFQAAQLSVSPFTSTVDDSHTAQLVRPSHFSVTVNLLSPQNNAENLSLR